MRVKTLLATKDVNKGLDSNASQVIKSKSFALLVHIGLKVVNNFKHSFVSLVSKSSSIKDLRPLSPVLIAVLLCHLEPNLQSTHNPVTFVLPLVSFNWIVF
jgi:hypothetical protein